MKRTLEADLLSWAPLVLPYLPPSSLAAVAAACRSLRHLAFSVTAARSSDASRSFEKHPIPFLNPVGPHPYSYFLYSPSPLPASSSPLSQSWGGCGSLPQFPPKPAIFGTGFGCECGDCDEDPTRCPCFIPNLAEVMRECGSNCRCGSGCANRATQKGICVKLKIVRDLKKGWGLHADQFVKKDEFICEYAAMQFPFICRCQPIQKANEELHTEDVTFFWLCKISHQLSCYIEN